MTIESIFEEAGVHGWVHARCLHCDREYGAGSDEPVVLASVVEVVLVLEFARQVAAGQLDATDRIRLRRADRLGGTGTAGCADVPYLAERTGATVIGTETHLNLMPSTSRACCAPPDVRDTCCRPTGTTSTTH